MASLDSVGILFAETSWIVKAVSAFSSFEPDWVIVVTEIRPRCSFNTVKPVTFWLIRVLWSTKV